MQQETTGEAPPFADLLRRHRLAAGLTQQELCERSGISVQAISALERGWRRSPHRDTVAMLADCLGLKPVERTAFEIDSRDFGAEVEADRLQPKHLFEDGG